MDVIQWLVEHPVAPAPPSESGDWRFPVDVAGRQITPLVRAVTATEVVVREAPIVDVA